MEMNTWQFKEFAYDGVGRYTFHYGSDAGQYRLGKKEGFGRSSCPMALSLMGTTVTISVGVDAGRSMVWLYRDIGEHGVSVIRFSGITPASRSKVAR